MIKLSPFTIRHVIKLVYEQEGFAQACSMANLIDRTHYDYCPKCDTEVPVIDNHDERCLICGAKVQTNLPTHEQDS
jgi:hypothetical protein